MQFIDLNAQQKQIRSNIEKRIKNVLDHGKYIMGPEIYELESKLAEYVGRKHCISCSSGTDALLIPLMAEKIGAGDAVATDLLHTRRRRTNQFLAQELDRTGRMARRRVGQ